MKAHRITEWQCMARTVLSAVCLASSAWGSWNGAGVPDGTGGTNINDTANWAGGVIDGDFSTIIQQGTTQLVLTDDQTFADVDAVSRSGISFSSGSTALSFTNATGVATGQLVAGTGIPYNTVLIALNGTNGILSQTTTAAAGGYYSFIRPALAFNFGVYGTRTNGISLVIGSSRPGVTRTISVNRRLVLSQRTSTRNTVTFSDDIVFDENFSDAWSVTRESGAIGGSTVQPLIIINGPVVFADGNGRAFGLNGGDCTFNGPISGSGRFIDPGPGLPYAGILTLAHPGSTFDGGVLFNSATGELIADSTNALANIGTPSALGAGGDLSIRNRTVTLKGFTVPQISDRRWRIGGGASARLVNDGGAPLILNGAVGNPYASGTWQLLGSYHNFGSPNSIGGSITNSAYVLDLMARGGAWRLTNDGNTFTGVPSVAYADQSALQFTSVADAGIPSALGAGSRIEINCGSGGSSEINYLEYVGGAPASTDRTLALVGNTDNSGNTILVNGGPLAFTGIVTNETTRTAIGSLRTRSLRLGGTGDGVTSGSVRLADNINENNQTARVDIVKIGSGTWTIGGSGLNHQGSTEVRSGTLVLDYTGGDQIPNAAPGGITVQGGKLVFRGKPTGTTSDTIGNVLFGSDAINFRPSSLKLDANGGDGVELMIGNFNADNQSQRYGLFDLSSSSGNTLTLAALGSSVAFKYGVLGMTSSCRGLFLIRTGNGYAFAATNGLGQVVPMVPTAPMPTTGGNAESNYLLDTSATLTGNLAFNTLTIKADTAPLTLALGAKNLTANAYSRALLFLGTNDVTVSSTGGMMLPNTAFYWNFLGLQATLHYQANIRKESTFQYVTWGGTGFTLYSGLSLGSRFALFGGVFRMTADQTLNVADTPLVVTDGGVLEIGADLNGAADGHFTLTCGTASGNLALYGDAGLSAAGTGRTVNLGGAGTTLTWGTNGFLTHVDNADYGYTLKLSSPRADAMIDFQNPIDLNGNTPHGRRRTVEVADGAAAVDARLSGAVSGHSTLVKTGAGTLEVTAVQNYDALEIADGTFKAASGCFTNATALCLDGGALTATGANTFGALEIATNSVLTLVPGSALSFADSAAVAWDGTLTLNGTWTEGAVRFGSDGTGLTSDQLAHITIGTSKVALTEDGYLRRILCGTKIRL